MALAAGRQVRSAALVAALLGFLSLLAGVRTWSERRHPDLETVLGIGDALLTLILAYALSRGKAVAAWLLLALAAIGASYTLWNGRPAFAILPQVVGALLYARTIVALGHLRAQRSRA